MGDNTRIRETCGWVPIMTMEETLKRMLDFWRNVL
jgi:nucleoside-diphosphate-sugar epimerase